MLDAQVWTPADMKEAWTLREKFHLQSCFIAGGTLLQTQWEKGVPYPPQLISLEKVEGLEGINYKTEGTKHFLQIGAMTKLAACRNHPVIKEKWSLLSTAIQQIAAPAVRNLGTIGGNVANRFGDAIPALLTMDAEVSYFDGNTIITEKLDHWLNTSQNNEVLLTGVILPEYRRSSFAAQFYKKVGRRESFSGSVVTVSGVIGKNDAGVIDFVRLAAGGGDNRPHRLKETEQLLIDQTINPDLLRNAYETIINEFYPISDVFYSDDYRRWIAANIIISELSGWERKG